MKAINSKVELSGTDDGFGLVAGASQAAGVWAGALVGAGTGALSGVATSSLTQIGNNLISGKNWKYDLDDLP